MKVIYRAGNRKSLSEMDCEAQDAVRHALELVEGKPGFRTPFEVWRNCTLTIVIGHNICTTSIQIRPVENDILNRSDWHNGNTYYCDGIF